MIKQLCFSQILLNFVLLPSQSFMELFIFLLTFSFDTIRHAAVPRKSLFYLFKSRLIYSEVLLFLL